MGKNLKKLYSFRTDDIIIKKLNYIAEQNTRTRNQEIEMLIKNHIKKYELENGEIKLDSEEKWKSPPKGRTL